MIDTQQKAADLVQEAAKQGKIALYLESGKNGSYRVIMPEGEYRLYAEMLYRAADMCADHANGHASAIRLRD